MLALYISLLDTEEQISKFEHIYTKYRGLMFYTAKGVLQDSYLAEDAVHETFLDIIRIIDSIRANNEKELSQFLRVLTHHKAVDMVRKCTRQKKSDTEIEDLLRLWFLLHLHLPQRDGAMLRPSLPVSPLVTTTTHVKSVVFLAQPKLIAPLFFMKKGYSEHILKFLVLPPPIMDTHMSFLVQLISNPVPLTS